MHCICLKVWRMACRHRQRPKRKIPMPQKKEARRQLQAAREPLSSSRMALAMVQGRQHRVSYELTASRRTLLEAAALQADC